MPTTTFIECFNCCRWHPKDSGCLTKEQQLDAASFPVYYARPFVALSVFHVVPFVSLSVGYENDRKEFQKILRLAYEEAEKRLRRN